MRSDLPAILYLLAVLFLLPILFLLSILYLLSLFYLLSILYLIRNILGFLLNCITHHHFMCLLWDRSYLIILSYFYRRWGCRTLRKIFRLLAWLNELVCKIRYRFWLWAKRF